MLLTREKSLQSPPMIKTEVIAVPEFGEGCEMAVRGLTARQRWAFGQVATKASEEGNNGPEPSSYLITLAAIDGDGHTLFQTQDCDAIAEWPGDVVDRIGTVVMEMSGLAPKAIDAAKNDSATTPSTDTPSDSDDSSDAPSPN